MYHGYRGKKQNKLLFLIPSIFLGIIAVIILLGAIYLNDYYHTDFQAVAAFSTMDALESDGETNIVTVYPLNNKATVYAPLESATCGFIFYPGGKVEHTAYEPLMKSCAAQGILCVLLEVPFRVAMLDTNAADGIQNRFPEIDRWYIGGHSLGGSVAGSYLADHTEAFDGLILLGSYVINDLSDTNLDILSVYGSEDRVLNMENYEKNTEHLPETFTEVVIDGGCHAYFGTYGAQDGDGTPAITNWEQIDLTVKSICNFIASE
ncbi:MAG: alpha/beta hydrolase [Oscillospiraceae bacterium]|nr:alpha/beta hydrolase [Oscillospiraceae bacterium]